MKRMLPLILLFTVFSAKSQNEGFPYDPNPPIFNSPLDTTASVKRLRQALNILNEFRIDAYLQAEWQRTDTAGGGTGSVKGISGVQGGQFPASANNRFLLRRARMRLAFDHKGAKGFNIVDFAFQFEGNEKGFSVKELNGRVIDPWTGWFGIMGGIFKRQFGYETPAASQYLESPEEARVNQNIFPNDYELGGIIVIESPCTFTKFYFRADASLVNGNGIGVGSETGAYQNRKDFIGRIKAGKAWNLYGGANQQAGTTLGINGGVSIYNGGVLQTTPNVYEVVDGVFENVTKGTPDTAQQLKKYYNRTYYGAYLEAKADYYVGTTAIRAEYITGTQPGTLTASQVPTGTGTAVPGEDLYIRNFNGGIFYLVQSFKNHLRDWHTIYHDITLKFDWYNPNTSVKQRQLTSENGFTYTDVKYSTMGAGYTFAPYAWFKLVVWYDYVINASTGQTGYRTDYKKDNVLTIRTQFNIDTWWFKTRSETTDNLMTKNY